MPLPGDVSTFTLSGGPYTDAAGTVVMVGVTGTLVPVDGSGRPTQVVHSADGATIVPESVPITIGAGGTWSVTGLAHTDDTHLSPAGFLYRVTWKVPAYRASVVDKLISVPIAAGSIVDFDLLAPTTTTTGVVVNVPVHGLPVGGTTGQVLSKVSGTDFDATWTTGSGGGAVSDATGVAKGVVQLAGDIGGTAAAPTVTGGAHHTHTAAQVSDSTTVGRAVLTAADAATARAATGAGTSNLALGTTGTTAAAGNDARLSDTRIPADASVTDVKVATGAAINADKLADGTTNKLLTATERTKLTGIATGATANSTDAQLRDRATHTGTQAATTITGLGGAATLNVGTAAGTVAAADDSRITGAAQKSANLSDLASAATARTNLGLGTAATQPSGAFVAASVTAPGAVAPNDYVFTSATFNSVVDPILKIGYNAAETITAEPVMRLCIEGDYKTDPTTFKWADNLAHHTNEVYFEYKSPDKTSVPGFRPFYLGLLRDDNTSQSAIINLDVGTAGLPNSQFNIKAGATTLLGISTGSFFLGAIPLTMEAVGAQFRSTAAADSAADFFGNGTKQWCWSLKTTNASTDFIFMDPRNSFRSHIALSGGASNTAALSTFNSSVKVNGNFGVNGNTPVGKAAAIASPTSDTVGTKTAIDAIRAALTAVGITA